MTEKNPKCILCSSKTRKFYKSKKRNYYQCTNCYSIILNPGNYVSPEEEKARYLQHNNDINDPGYQHFVSPIVHAVLENQESSDAGLDYGSGTGPVISKLLKDKGFNILTYDPIFNKQSETLDKIYDYIVCCEVIEHFHDPVEEFTGLRKILKPGGILYCMSYLYSEELDFKTWNYKDDQTHVIIYHSKGIEWIKEEFGFEKVEIQDRLITFYG